MQDNIIFKDVGLVTLKTVSGRTIAYGLLDETGIDHIVNSTDIRTGTGNTFLYRLYEMKDLEVNVTPTIGILTMMGLQTKNVEAFKTGQSVNVQRTVTLDAVDNAGSTEIDVTDYVSVDDDYIVIDVVSNETVASTYATQTITLDTAPVGKYNVVFVEAVTADTLTVDSNEFPEVVEDLTIQTPGYDLQTGEKLGMLYISIPYAMPDGNFSLAFSKAENSNYSVNFKAKPPILGTKLADIYFVPEDQA